MLQAERRRKPRLKAYLLVSFRCLKEGVATSSGFLRTLDLSEEGALLESPDAFPNGQEMALQFLLDYDRIVDVEGHVSRVTKAQNMYHVAVAFDDVSRAARRLLSKQVEP